MKRVCAGMQSFQSTLSVRRATVAEHGERVAVRISIHALRKESDHGGLDAAQFLTISIHALRKESDVRCRMMCRMNDISIHALRKESDGPEPHISDYAMISIHALRKESDDWQQRVGRFLRGFQSTLSVRRATRCLMGLWSALRFQSTLSVRRATQFVSACLHVVDISIHALRKESDLPAANEYRRHEISIHALRKESDPLPRAQWRQHLISIHALRKESDWRSDTACRFQRYFNPRSP